MAAGIVLGLAVTAPATPVSDAGPRAWTFAEDPVGEPPRGWEVLSGAWQVRLDEDGRNRVLVQVGPPLPGSDLPAILAPGPALRDVRAAVRIKTTGTGALETMGLILRWRDPGTMTVIRVEGTPGRVGLERVQEGRRLLRAGYIIPLHGDRWNILRITAQGDWINLFLNGRFLGGAREDEPVSGRAGLMAGPGARVVLDDFEIEPVPGGAAPG
jgi:hypothetical protein